MLNKEDQGSAESQWDTGTHPDFYNHYEQHSVSPASLARFCGIRDALLRALAQGGHAAKPLDVLDIGCNAGAQACFWLEKEHRYCGIDINAPLIELARQRATEAGLPAKFEVGSATHLPFPDGGFDVCIMPELLEHVVEWQACLDEAVRVLRPGGVLYLSTSNWLCPVQQEFNLPCYSWYPPFLKRYYERRAVTDRPDLANYAKYPAVNWFSVYGLRAYLEPRGFACLDRFDLVDVSDKGKAAQLVLMMLRNLPPLRLLGHVMTPYTVLVARKSPTPG
jgi:2-polyprenyl-6-hydroxyphenyl methylase/3-demethylubiquinone-9 3-methyltransferase